MAAILVALETIACLIHRCTVYEHSYLNEQTEASKSLEKSLLQLCTAILRYLAKAIEESKSESFVSEAVPLLIVTQRPASRQYSPWERFKTASPKLRSGRKLLGTMLLLLPLNVFFSSTGKTAHNVDAT